MHARMSVQSSAAVVAKATVLVIRNSVSRIIYFANAFKTIDIISTDGRGIMYGETNGRTVAGGPPTWLKHRFNGTKGLLRNVRRHRRRRKINARPKTPLPPPPVVGWSTACLLRRTPPALLARHTYSPRILSPSSVYSVQLNAHISSSSAFGERAPSTLASLFIENVYIQTNSSLVHVGAPSR